MAKTSVDSRDARCSCGNAAIRIRAAPLFRFVCHCTLCQRFNTAPFADVLVYRARDIEPPAQEAVAFRTLRPPPNVQRGKCAKCDDPVIETLRIPLLPKLTMVPRSMHATDAVLPEPAAHMFYDSRVSDADDALPKYRGYLASQLAFGRYLLAAHRSSS